MDTKQAIKELAKSVAVSMAEKVADVNKGVEGVKVSPVDYELLAKTTVEDAVALGKKLAKEEA